MEDLQSGLMSILINYVQNLGIRMGSANFKPSESLIRKVLFVKPAQKVIIETLTKLYPIICKEVFKRELGNLFAAESTSKSSPEESPEFNLEEKILSATLLSDKYKKIKQKLEELHEIFDEFFMRDDDLKYESQIDIPSKISKSNQLVSFLEEMNKYEPTTEMEFSDISKDSWRQHAKVEAIIKNEIQIYNTKFNQLEAKYHYKLSKVKEKSGLKIKQLEKQLEDSAFAKRLEIDRFLMSYNDEKSLQYRIQLKEEELIKKLDIDEEITNFQSAIKKINQLVKAKKILEKKLIYANEVVKNIDGKLKFNLIKRQEAQEKLETSQRNSKLLKVAFLDLLEKSKLIDEDREKAKTYLEKENFAKLAEKLTENIFTESTTQEYLLKKFYDLKESLNVIAVTCNETKVRQRMIKLQEEYTVDNILQESEKNKQKMINAHLHSDIRKKNAKKPLKQNLRKPEPKSNKPVRRGKTSMESKGTITDPQTDRGFNYEDILLSEVYEEPEKRLRKEPKRGSIKMKESIKESKKEPTREPTKEPTREPTTEPTREPTTEPKLSPKETYHLDIEHISQDLKGALEVYDENIQQKDSVRYLIPDLANQSPSFSLKETVYHKANKTTQTNSKIISETSDLKSTLDVTSMNVYPKNTFKYIKPVQEDFSKLMPKLNKATQKVHYFSELTFSIQIKPEISIDTTQKTRRSSKSSSKKDILIQRRNNVITKFKLPTEIKNFQERLFNLIQHKVSKTNMQSTHSESPPLNELLNIQLEDKNTLEIKLLKLLKSYLSDKADASVQVQPLATLAHSFSPPKKQQVAETPKHPPKKVNIGRIKVADVNKYIDSKPEKTPNNQLSDQTLNLTKQFQEDFKSASNNQGSINSEDSKRIWEEVINKRLQTGETDDVSSFLRSFTNTPKYSSKVKKIVESFQLNDQLQLEETIYGCGKLKFLDKWQKIIKKFREKKAKSLGWSMPLGRNLSTVWLEMALSIKFVKHRIKCLSGRIVKTPEYKSRTANCISVSFEREKWTYSRNFLRKNQSKSPKNRLEKLSTPLKANHALSPRANSRLNSRLTTEPRKLPKLL